MAPNDDLPAALAENLDDSFERLVIAYQDRLYGFALRLSGCPADAEDIAQDAFVRAYRALARFPAERIRALAVKAWLFQITLNVFRNRYRDRQPESVPLRGSDGEIAFDPPDEGAGPETLAERRETGADLAARLLALPERYRVAVILRHVHGIGYGEIGVTLGQPVGTVKSNVHRGTKLLREQLIGPGLAS